MTQAMPRWEQRVRCPQIVPFSLIGDPLTRGTDAPTRGTLLTTLSGRVEVFTYDCTTQPATLRQVTDRAQGTLGGAVSSDGTHVLWFDDQSGNERGRWIREPFAGLAARPAITLATNLEATYNAGVVAQASQTFLGRLTDTGLELVVANESGHGTRVVQFDEPGALIDVSRDAAQALVAYAPNGDWIHPGVRVVDLATGEVVAQLTDTGRALDPIGFSPDALDERVLVGHERENRSVVLFWEPLQTTTTLIECGLDGDVSAQWWPGQRALLLTANALGRQSLHRYDLGLGGVTSVEAPLGTVYKALPSADGSVMSLVADSATPPRLVLTSGETVVELAKDSPASSVSAHDVFAEGPGGRVHALLLRPEAPSAPLPAVFLVHGGPTAQDVDAFHVTAAGLVDAGYAVVRVNYRGSTGYGRTWRDALIRRLGFIELEDVGAIRTELERTGVIDPDRVAMVGGSWGGFLTLFALGTEPQRWVCGCALVPLADWFIAHEDQPPFMTTYDNSLMGGTIADIPDAYRLASPITYVDSVTSPLFVTAGGNDPRCPPRQIDEYVERLRARGQDVRYEKSDAGHALFDMDAKVRELGKILSFVQEKMPVSDPISGHD